MTTQEEDQIVQQVLQNHRPVSFRDLAKHVRDHHPEINEMRVRQSAWRFIGTDKAKLLVDNSIQWEG